MVDSTGSRTSKFVQTPDQLDSWWVDAHMLLPLVLGPVAFLLTMIHPLRDALLKEGVIEFQVFLHAVTRLATYSGIGFVMGLLVRWLYYQARRARQLGAGVDVTVGDRGGQVAGEQVAGEQVAGEEETGIAVAVSIPIDLEHAQPGMKLAEPLATPDGQQLASSGVLLTEELIESARKANLSALIIEGSKYVVSDES